MAFIGGLIWALCTQTGDDPTRFVHARCEKEGVGTVAERIHVERLLDSVLAVAFACTANVVNPQIPLDRRLREYYGALAVGIPTAGTPLQAYEVAGLSVGNGHTCAFLGQPANNGVEVGSQRSVSRPGLPGFQLVDNLFLHGDVHFRISGREGGQPTALWQSHEHRIVTGDHIFADSMANLTVNAINCFDGSVRVY
jgi:hypothetical protein